MPKTKPFRALSNKDIINPHCQSPSLLIRSNGKWGVRLKYYRDGKLCVKEYNGILNSLTKKSEKTYLANKIIQDINYNLENKYFNPKSKDFEPIKKSDYPIMHYLSDFLKSKLGVISDETMEDYKRVYNRFSNYLDSLNKQSTPSDEIDRNFMVEYLDQHLLTDPKISKATRDQHLGTLKIYFNYLTNIKGLFTASPLKNVAKIHNGDTDKHRPYNETGLKTVLDLAKTYCYEFYVMLIFQYYSLARPTEILRLQFGDFDLEKKVIYFASDKTKTRRKKIFYIPEPVLAIIESWDLDWKNINPNFYFLGNTGKPKRGSKTVLKLFGEYKTGIQIFQNRFTYLRQKLELDKRHTFYGVKHTGTAKLTEMRVHDRKIMNLSGHRTAAAFEIYLRDLGADFNSRIDRDDVIY